MSGAKATITRVYTDALVAARGSNETLALYTVPKGSRVLAVSAQVIISASAGVDSTWWLGDSGDADGFIQSFSTEQTAGAWIGTDTPATSGAYQTDSGGKLYNADTVVNAYYTQASTDGTTEPKIRSCLWIGTPQTNERLQYDHNVYVIQKQCRVSDAAVAEDYFIYKARPGDRVIACDVQKTTLAGSSTNSDFQVGDATDPDGFATVVDTEAGTAADFVDNSGAYLALSGGKLYTVQTDVVAKYTPNSTPGTTKPNLLVRLWVVKK